MLTPLANLSMETQGDHEDWCWASVTAAVSNFLDRQQYSIEDIAQQILPGCDETGGAACEIPWPLESALSTMNHLDRSISGTIPFPNIQHDLIDLGLPVAIGITYTTDMGTILHYCLIANCSVDGTNELLLLNPALPDPCEYSISYGDLVQGDVMNAVWTDSFYVHK